LVDGEKITSEGGRKAKDLWVQTTYNDLAKRGGNRKIGGVWWVGSGEETLRFPKTRRKTIEKKIARNGNQFTSFRECTKLRSKH